MTHCLVSLTYGRLIDVKILQNDKHRTAIRWPLPLYRGGSIIHVQWNLDLTNPYITKSLV